jgi:chromosome segregation ATPase
LAASKAQLEDERSQLEAAISALHEERKAEEPLVSALTQDCAKCEADITGLNQTQAQIRADTNAVKERIAALKDEVASVQFETLSTEEDTQAAALLLVASPDRVKAEVAHMESSAFAEKAALKETEDAKRTLKGQLAVIAQAESDVQQLSAALADFTAELHRSQECSGQVADAQRAVDMQAAEAAEMDAEREHLEAQLKRLQEKVTDVRHSHDAKASAVTRAVEGMQAEYTELMQSGDAASELHKEGLSQQEDMQGALAEAKGAHEADMTQLLAHLRELQREVKNYHAKLFAGLGQQAACRVVIV